jgi:hypothetical protein
VIPEVEHTDVGAYALGLLDDADRRAFAEHLSGCPSCTAELAGLTGLAGAFRGVAPVEPGEDEPAEPPAGVAELVRRRTAADRKARRGTFVIGLAAAVVLVAGGIAVGTTMAGGGAALSTGHSAHSAPSAPLGEPTAPSAPFGEPSAPSAQPAGDSAHAGHGPAEMFFHQGTPIAGQGRAGISGGLVVKEDDWGSHAALELKGIRGPLECELVVVSESGEERVVTGWAVPDEGFGVPGSPQPLYVHGGSALPLDRIDRFEVVTTGGSTLLTVNGGW